MKHSTSLEKVFHYLQFLGKLITIWPARIGAGKTEVLFTTIKWWISFVNVTFLLIPLALAIYYFHNDSVLVTKNISVFTAVSEIFCNLVQCKRMKKHLQIILNEIEEFIMNADELERITLQKYINRYKYYQLVVGSIFVFTAALFCFMPLFTSQIFPADVWYPFPIESLKIRIFLYVSQIVAIMQTGIGVTVDFIIAMMFYYSATQIELLDNKVKRASNEITLKNCAYTHKKLIEFTDRVLKVAKIIILKSNILMTLTIVSSALQLLQHQPLEILFQFMLMVVAACSRLYITAEPANDLRENCDSLAQSAFYVALKQNSPSASKIALMLGVRSQKPIVLTVSGIINTYTLQYYATFLFKTLSYFVNLRAVVEK